MSGRIDEAGRRAAVQQAAWTRLWEILLTPRLDDVEGQRNGSARVDETRAAAGGEVPGDGGSERHPSP